MDYELAALNYLAHEGLFVSPQFSVPCEGGSEWSCPDLVGLDIPKHQVVVAEVTTASNIRSLAAKVRNREEQWFRRVRQLLERKAIITPDWSFRAWVFVRQDCVEQMEREVGGSTEVTITALEEVAFPWKWNWPPALQR